MGGFSWICPPCLLSAFPFSNTTLNSTINSSIDSESNDGSHDDSRGIYALQDNEQLENKRKNCNDILLFHLNINSIQNKLEELFAVIRKLKAHNIIFISEKKIDSTYPDNQFTIPGYTLYRNGRKKGGGGILIYVLTLLPCKRLRINRTFKTLEPLAVYIRVGTTDMIIIGIYLYIYLFLNCILHNL